MASRGPRGRHAMFQTTPLLQETLQALRRVCGAASATLWVPGEPGVAPVTVHEGEGAPPDTAGAAARLTAAEPGRAVAASPGRWLVRVDVPPPPAGPAGDRPSSGRRAAGPAAPRGPAWIDLRVAGAGPLAASLDGEPAAGLLRLAAGLGQHAGGLAALLHDPVTGLPGRAQLTAGLRRALGDARATGRPVALLLATPGDVDSVSRRPGGDGGDRVMAEIARRMRVLFRDADGLASYGGAVFAALLAGAGGRAARAVARRVRRRLSDPPLLDPPGSPGARDRRLDVDLAVGIAVCGPGEAETLGALDLIHRANRALNAARHGSGEPIAVWSPQLDDAGTGGFDPLSGIVTGSMRRDSRNVSLLWEAVTAFAASDDAAIAAGQVIDAVCTAFSPLGAGLAIAGEAGPSWSIAPDGAAAGTGVVGERRTLLERALDGERVAGVVLAGQDAQPGRRAWALPLAAGDEPAALYLEGAAGSFHLDETDLAFLAAVAGHLALALARARLAEQERRRRESAGRRLCEELERLRGAARRSELAYASGRMKAVLATARRVAPTDATVLITGESGTGKEVLARMLHQLSGRSKKPLVVVDCGAIDSSLIDSELFGHERGVADGAGERRPGRLAEADGATLLLDELGELPLEVQGKLLRFVQDKRLTPVGSSGSQRADVRVIATTNRDLASQVHAGMFRADLFYRLAVVRLVVPPLRERPDDVLHLARHFVRTFSARYRKALRLPSRELERALLAWSWPGNVRELEDRVMQAVILCEGDELSPAELGLDGDEPRELAAYGVDAPARTTSGVARPSGPAAVPPATPTAGTVDEVLEGLRGVLAERVDEAAREGRRGLVPLGTWLGEDLVLLADAETGQVARRAAELVGLPETTFRRRLRKAVQRLEAGLSPRPDGWEAVRAWLAQLIRVNLAPAGDLLELTQRMLLEEVVARFPDDVGSGSALMGVSGPTYRRRVCS